MRSVFTFSVIVLISFSQSSYAQKSLKPKRAERAWAVRHPFIAPGVLKITRSSLAVVREYRGKHGLDTARSEGTLDAFRHAYWMASLSQKFRKEKALSLGEAHEQSNYKSFLKREKEHGIIPDKPNSDMDLWNNRVGAEIGDANKKVSSDSLKTLVLQAIASGRMKVIRKDAQGAYLDCNGQVIPPEKTKGTWDNPKCLIPSSLK